MDVTHNLEAVQANRLQRILKSLISKIGPERIDARRLERIQHLFSPCGVANLGECFSTLYPDAAKPQDAQDAFRKFRQNVNEAGGSLGIRFECDTNLKTNPEKRKCWFEAEADDFVKQAFDFSEAAIEDLSVEVVPPRIQKPWRDVSIFISYAHANGDLVEEFISLLKQQAAPFGPYRFRLLSDHGAVSSGPGIPSGERWHDWIQQAISDCDFGLLLVSPSYLGSGYIIQHEIPRFHDENKPYIPVIMQQISPHHDMMGLKDHQYFSFQPRPQESGKSYFDCNDNERYHFAQLLYERIVSRLDAIRWDSAPVMNDRPATLAIDSAKIILEPDRPISDELLQLASQNDNPRIDGFVESNAKKINLHGSELAFPKNRTTRTNPENAISALAYLKEWVCAPFNSDKPQSSFFALLGEYGVGKTTCLKELTRQLLQAHASDSKTPIPIFCDLRNVSVDKGIDTQVPTLEQILQVTLNDWKRGSTTANLTAERVLRAVQGEGVVIIFDGLDEVIIHLTPDRSRRFMRELWRILPPFDRRRNIQGAVSGKLIVSCRSHYFKDFWSQNAFFTGESRDGIKPDHYAACILLPFNEKQVRQYLENTVGRHRVKHVLELFDSVHNLHELATRPFLLSEMVLLIEQLERMKVDGERVLGVTLYELVVRKWLNRDDGKHHFTETDKRQLMEALSAALFLSGQAEWEWSKVEKWLTQFLFHQPAIAASYAHYQGQKKEILLEDLRAATFIVRSDLHFRFAHTSIQEFFLASYLVNALDEGALERWQMPLPSIETLDFLGQLLSVSNQAVHIQRLNSLLNLGGPSAFLALHYWRLARENGYPVPNPTKPNFEGLDLSGWKFLGDSKNPWALHYANFTRAQITGTEFRFCVLYEANFCEADATHSCFYECNLSNSKWEMANITGSRVEKCKAFAINADWVRSQPNEYVSSDAPLEVSVSNINSMDKLVPADMHGASMIETVVIKGHSGRVTGCAWSSDDCYVLSASKDKTLRIWDETSGAIVREFRGHLNEIRACAWSDDGRQVLSASEDQTLRIWDTNSGCLLHTLQGHNDTVLDCAWSRDGRYVLSASEDTTLRIWEASSGKLVHVLKGHSATVSGCAWSNDDRWVLSASDDKTLRIWETCSGTLVRKLKGHAHSVSDCAWSNDGRCVLSASWDKTLRIWNAADGTLIRELKGHDHTVSACAWSNDGRRVLSASWDKTLRIWDATNGASIHILKEHAAPILDCAWSNDGRWILSASEDTTLRIWEANSGMPQWRSTKSIGHHIG